MTTLLTALLIAFLGLCFTATSLLAKEPEANTGKAPKEEAGAKTMGKTVRGQVNRVEMTDGTKILYIIAANGKTKMFKSNNASKMLILGKPGTFDDLKEGMHVAMLSAFESGSAIEIPKTIIYLVAAPDKVGPKPYRNWDGFGEQWAKLSGEAGEAQP